MRVKFQKSSLARTARHLHACEGQSIEQRRRKRCKECGGASICPPRRVRSVCTVCGGRGLCRVRSRCKEFGGGSICDHQRIRSDRRECAGPSICEHKRRRNRCTECGGGGLCEHQRERSKCKACREDADESMPDGLEELGESTLGGRDAPRVGGIAELRRAS